MKNTLIASTIALCGVVIFQFKQSSDLKQENEELRQAAKTRSSGLHQSLNAADRSNKASRRTDTQKSGAREIKSLLAIKNPSDRIEAIMAYVKGLPTSEIPAALEELRRVSPHWDPEGKMLAHILLSRWARADPEAALASLKGIDLKRYGEAPFSVISAIAAQDPQRAITWLDSQDNPLKPYGWLNQFLAGTIAKEWVRQDEAAALAWARGLPGKERNGALGGALVSIAMTDAKRASEIAMELEPGKDRGHILGEIAQAWASNSPSEAIAWAEGIEDEDERHEAVSRSIQAWAQQNTQDAANYVAQHLDDGNPGQLIKAVTDAWVGQEPDAAAKWIAELDTDQGAQAMGSAMWHWTNRDAEAAAVWLREQPAGPVRDQGITGLAKASFEFDRPAALSWAQEIQNDELRESSTRIGIHAWLREEPEQAAQWAQENGVALPQGHSPKIDK